MGERQLLPQKRRLFTNEEGKGIEKGHNGRDCIFAGAMRKRGEGRRVSFLRRKQLQKTSIVSERGGKDINGTLNLCVRRGEGQVTLSLFAPAEIHDRRGERKGFFAKKDERLR